MHKIELILGITCFSLVGNAFAGDNYIARSKTDGDACYMTAKVTTMNDQKGILFKAVATDNDRLDAHCDKVVMKLKNGQEVFVLNMTADSLTNCRFDEHHSKAGDDDESNKLTSSKFVAE